jgi:adenylate kinase family enzyme
VKRVAVFGNTGAGKSTLARRLTEITRLPLYTIDVIQFPDGGNNAKVSHDEYLKMHAELLKKDEWIIDGFDSVPSAWERFAAADTLVYVDLPVAVHYWWVTKRLIKGLFANPEGWPSNSPIWASSMDSYKVVWRCHRRLTPKYRKHVADAVASKRVHHLKSPAEIAAFLVAVEREHVGASQPGDAGQ